MSRIIQDSDDELDDDLEVDMQITDVKDASSKQSASDASSTEALRRQIEAAHRAHLQSQFPENDSLTALVSLEVNHQKRKAPIEFDLYSPTESTTGANGVLDSPLGGLKQDGSSRDQISQPPDQHDGTNWVLEGTMREAYAQHNPNTLFPEPSSTVPNATLTQQRVLEGVVAPALLGSEIDGGRTPFQPDASIPWSEYLKSPLNTGEQPKSSAQHSRMSQHTSFLASNYLSNDDSCSSMSQSNRRASLNLAGYSSPRDRSMGMVDRHESAMSQTNEAASGAALPQASPYSAVNKMQRDNTTSSLRDSRNGKRVSSPGSISDDDLADLRLPKERYKPRPSRSRSLKADTQEPIDSSVRPEKTVRASRRIKSTPTNTALTNRPSTPDKIQQICDMGFTPSTSAKALKRNNGDVTQSVDWLITSGVADDELVSHASKMSPRDEKQTARYSDTNKHDGDHYARHVVGKQAMPTDLGTVSDTLTNDTAIALNNTVLPVMDLRSPAKVQVVIPAKSPNSAAEKSATLEISRKETKRKKKTLVQPEPVAPDDAVTEDRTTKKRGRGRPKKVAKPASSVEVVHEDEEEVTQEPVCDSALLSIDGNARPTLARQQAIEDAGTLSIAKSIRGSDSFQLEDRKTAAAISKVTPDEPQELPDRPEVEPITPERVKKLAPREQHLSKAKVAHRVGLSKRTRIAPLLRVIKK